MLPIIAISIGDVNGIGPEVVLKAFDRTDLFDLCRPVVFAPPGVLEYYRERFGVPVDLAGIDDIAAARDRVLNVIATAGTFTADEVGRPTEAGGQASITAIEAAFAATQAGTAEAMVTAPVSKEAMAMAGSPFRGHTEMLASLCGTPEDVLMILSSNTMNVGLVTIHVPISQVAALITRERVQRTIRLAHRAMREDYGIEDPKLAVLGLNPHAGDGGLLGDEEQTIIAPAVAAMQAEEIDVVGPFAADGFFSAHTQQMYDIIIAMYHDQGLVPFKLQAMGRGVNVTVGLPIVRTSPDHGTAYNIAGRGVASAASMTEAIFFARTIALNRAS
ncbi:MAG: 4-hydroxythreonine-4-phosphate dehydrogenase PdxA [Bacteroidota bacterium]|jgi:4-hydroxythreonine-4-phosphate dehydrogenase|nr:4-hydroxythreonine-4-phosphate dehydrogenase PdxA [Bacteroidota bacterium]